MTAENESPPARHATRRVLVYGVAGGLILLSYGLCWALGMVYVPARVLVNLPRYDYPANARATLHVDNVQRETRSWSSPLPSPLNFDWQISGGFAWSYWDTRGDFSVVVEVQGCQPVTVPLACTPWTVRAPNFTLFGAWGASFSKECSGRGEVVCTER